MITGAHAILYSTDADADSAFLRDVLGLPHVDVGDGWLVFGLPPAEVAVHPGNVNDAAADSCGSVAPEQGQPNRLPSEEKGACA